MHEDMKHRKIFFIFIFFAILILSVESLFTENTAWSAKKDRIDNSSDSSGIIEHEDPREMTSQEETSIPGFVTTQPTRSQVSSTEESFIETLIPMDSGVCSMSKTALHEESLKYLAFTPEEADSIARRIGFIDGRNESASNACGPLSIAILRDGGLLPADLNIHDSWILCLRDREDCSGLETLQKKFFSPDHYDYIRVTESVREYDFVSNPLQPADWLYLYACCNGFDHMLVVTRVDDDGAAYTVTNLDRGDGFTIVEEKLYDPNNPGEGLFYELTDKERGFLGLSGNGGFLLVRKKDDWSTHLVNNDLGSHLIDGVHWNALIKEIGRSDNIFERLPDEIFHPASMIKIPIAMVFLQIAEDQGLDIIQFNEKGYGGRTFDQLLRAMVVKSEEEATALLISYVRQYSHEQTILEEWGFENTSFEPRKTTANDLAGFLERLFSGLLLKEESREYLLDLMSIQTKNDTQYLGVLQTLVEGSVFYNKRGTLLDPVTIAGDMGILTVGNKSYVLVIAGKPDADGSATFEEMKDSIEKFAKGFSRILVDILSPCGQ